MKDASIGLEDRAHGIKIVVVVLAGVAVFLHQRADLDGGPWPSGERSGPLASVAALCLGVFLAG